jgi:hypothetical protein
LVSDAHRSTTDKRKTSGASCSEHPPHLRRQESQAKITPTVLEPEFSSSAADPGRDGGSVTRHVSSSSYRIHPRLSLCVFALLVSLLFFFMQHQFSLTNARSAMRVVVPQQVVQSIDQRDNSTMRVVLPNGAIIVLEPRQAAPAIDDRPNATSAAAQMIDAPDTPPMINPRYAPDTTGNTREFANRLRTSSKNKSSSVSSNTSARIHLVCEVGGGEGPDPERVAGDRVFAWQKSSNVMALVQLLNKSHYAEYF